jgi:hypothetical protein
MLLLIFSKKLKGNIFIFQPFRKNIKQSHLNDIISKLSIILNKKLLLEKIVISVSMYSTKKKSIDVK